MSAPGLRCPFCNSGEIELVSAWGAQIITSQVRCRSCNSYFEAVREDFAIPPDDGSEHAPPAGA
jgi:hypothetical protein